MTAEFVSSSTHWGTFLARDGAGGLQVRPHPLDPAPSPLLDNIGAMRDPAVRIARPAIRAGWLRDGPGPSENRGREPFVEVEWPELIELLSGELRRVHAERGPAGVYGGSYGWASAGRFHHAQSQLHRFLNCLGGYVRSVNNYSYGASMVLMPHLVGPAVAVTSGLTDWPVIARHTELIVAFGGIPRKNTHIASGGITAHTTAGHLADLDASGTEIVAISPLRDDVPETRGARWLPIRPASDVALMLALMHVLFAEDLADREFLDRYCVGGGRLEAHVARYTPEWAAPLCEIDPGDIRALARRMASRRTLVTVTWSLQRAEHGEQAPWAGLALAAVLGGIGLPGQGFGHGYGSMGDVGVRGPGTRIPRLAQGHNPVAEFIPVARVSDMLLHPGEPFRYDGATLTYPDVALVYWAGGNPFHHHQDLHRLRRALARVDTLVVHEPFWTAAAKHADIVVPVTTAVERSDIGAVATDRHVVPMHAVAAPLGQARDDYTVFAELAAALGVEHAFTEGRTARQWLEHLYDGWAATTRARLGVELPDAAEFLAGDVLTLPEQPNDRTFLEQFRADPVGHRLGTPSGRIELYSATIAGFGDPDCPGLPTWMEPEEWLGSAGSTSGPRQLHLIAHQPRRRLHSQLDAGAESARGKVAGREAATLHPADAAARGIADGDVVRLSNDRGACLAGAVLSDGVRRGVIVLPTGAWFDPLPDGTCAHGNPNVLTRDRGTSSLAQGCTGQHALVEVERYRGEPPEVRAFGPPDFAPRTDSSHPAVGV